MKARFETGLGAVAIIASMAAASSSAYATELFTPASQAPVGQIRCVITNVGTTPTEVTAAILGQNGVDITGVNGCPQPPSKLAAGAFCSSITTAPVAGYCRFTSQSIKARGVLLVVDIANAVVSALPATK